MLSHPAAGILLALGSTLLLARLVRVRPVLAPLLAPYALTALGLVVSRALPVDKVLGTALVMLPLLVLVVRASVLLIQVVFRRHQGMEAPALLGSVASVVLYGLGAAVIAKSGFGVDLTPFLATSAVLGAVLGLALQDSLGNLFAGIALHSEGPFRVGDWVRVADRDGRVEEVSWRATRLRTWDGDALTVPNAQVSKNQVLNYSQPRGPHTRVLTIGVAYHVPPNKVLSVIREVLDQVDGVPPDPPLSIRLVRYEDSAMTYEIRYPFARYEDWRRIEHEVNRLLWYHFRRHAIEIPFPSRNVFLQQAPGATAEGGETTARLQRTLRGIDLFRALSDAELQLAVRRFRPLHYAVGERILEEGDSGDSFFVIDGGQVDVLKTIAGVQRKVARLSEGQFFGEMALLTGEKRSATVVAATEVDLYTLDKSGFQDVLVGNPEIAVEVSAILTARREALHQAEGDVTQKFEAASQGEKQQRLLERIRGYFGL